MWHGLEPDKMPDNIVDCIKAYIIDEPAMREKDMNGVRKRVVLDNDVFIIEHTLPPHNDVFTVLTV